jgi:hypothetical protein
MGNSAELHNRPIDPPLDHLAFARAGFEAEAQRSASAIKAIDLRMENTEEEIARLRRQMADDRRELSALEIAHRAANRAIAELDGVA